MLSYLSENDLRLQPDFDLQAVGLNSTSFGFMILPSFIHSSTKHLVSTKESYPVLGVCVEGEENGPQWINLQQSLTLCSSWFWYGVIMQTYNGDVECLSFFSLAGIKYPDQSNLEFIPLHSSEVHCGGKSSLQELAAACSITSTAGRQRTRYARHCSASFLH